MEKKKIEAERGNAIFPTLRASGPSGISRRSLISSVLFPPQKAGCLDLEIWKDALIVRVSQSSFQVGYLLYQQNSFIFYTIVQAIGNYLGSFPVSRAPQIHTPTHLPIWAHAFTNQSPYCVHSSSRLFLETSYPSLLLPQWIGPPSLPNWMTSISWLTPLLPPHPLWPSPQPKWSFKPIYSISKPWNRIQTLYHDPLVLGDPPSALLNSSPATIPPTHIPTREKPLAFQGHSQFSPVSGPSHTMSPPLVRPVFPSISFSSPRLSLNISDSRNPPSFLHLLFFPYHSIHAALCMVPLHRES